MSDLLNSGDLERSKKHDTFHSEVITGKVGGLAAGADIDYSTNAVTLQTQKTMPKLFDELQTTINDAGGKFGFVVIGDFSTGFTIEYRNQLGQKTDGTTWRYAGVLPHIVTAGTVPSAPDYEQISLQDHNSATNINAVGGHDAIYDRGFGSYFEMLSYTGHSEGLKYSTGGTLWKVNTSGGVPLGGGLFVKPINQLYVTDFGVDNTGVTTTSAQFRAMYDIATIYGWLDIEVPAGIYSVDGLPSDDEYLTGWLLPWDGVVQYSPVVNINISAGAKLYATSGNMIIIRACKDNVKFTGAGEVNGNNTSIGIAFCPEDLNQTTDIVSQQFGYVAPTLNFGGLYAAIMTQCGPTVGLSDSGSFYHTLGGKTSNCSYPYWAKDTLTSNQNFTTRTQLIGFNSIFSVSSAKIDAGEIRMQNCNFEGMSGEVIEFKQKGAPTKIIDNSLYITNTIFEVFAQATLLREFGISIGPGVSFINPTPARISGTQGATHIPTKLRLGSYGGSEVLTHVMEQAVTSPTGNLRSMTTQVNGDTGQLDYYSETLTNVRHYIRNDFKGLQLIANDFDLSRGVHSTQQGHGVYISSGNNGITHFNKQEGSVGVNYKLHYMENSSGSSIYEVRGSGDVYNASGTYGMISDVRTKNITGECRDYTDEIMQLSVKKYTSKIDNNQYIGLIAQDVELIFPSLVSTVESGDFEDLKSVKTTPLIFMLLKMCQEQELRIRALES